MTRKKDANVDAVFGGETVPKHARLPDRKVQPWHKPRKQYIRRFQWLKEIDRICDQLHFKDSRPLRYLSLPGEDLLDIRVVQECCKKRKIQLKFLGLNDDYSSDTPNTWLHIACNELTALPSIHRDSTVIRDRFEKIDDPESQAFRYLGEYGPFDVVNLDLCSSISPLRSGPHNYYGALTAIAEQQMRERPLSEPWLLLITSRVGGPWVAESDLNRLAKCVAENATSYKDFARDLDAVAPGVMKAFEGKLKWADLLQPHFVNFFTIALGKWMLKLLGSGHPKWDIRLLDSYAYRVKSDSPDMVSLAFRVEGCIEPPRDNFGLAKQKRAPAGSYDERTSAMTLIQGVRSIADIDTFLMGDQTVYSAMERETGALLAASRYRKSVVEEGFRRFKAKMR